MFCVKISGVFFFLCRLSKTFGFLVIIIDKKKKMGWEKIFFLQNPKTQSEASVRKSFKPLCQKTALGG